MARYSRILHVALLVCALWAASSQEDRSGGQALLPSSLRRLADVLPRFETRKLEISFRLGTEGRYLHHYSTLSPDGSKIVANVVIDELSSAQRSAFPSYAKRAVVVINTDSGNIFPLGKAPLNQYGFPIWPLVWGQTSDALLYTHYNGKSLSLFKISLPSPMTFTLSAAPLPVPNPSNPCIWDPGDTSPNDRWLILERKPDGIQKRELYIASWNRLSQRRRLSPGCWASWSPDGKWIAHWRPRGWWREWDPLHEIYLPWIMSRSGKDARPLLTEEMLKAHVQPIEAPGLRAVSAYPPLAWIAKTGQIVCMGTHVRTDLPHKQGTHWWLFDPQGKRKPQVIETDAVLLAGSRDGKHLLLQAGKDEQTEYYLIDFQD